MWAFTVLHFHDGVIVARVDNGFFVHLGVGYIVYQRPANAASRARIDKAILRTSVESILAILRTLDEEQRYVVGFVL